MKRTEQATEGLSWEIREREESAWEEERDSISRTSQPASQPAGREGQQRGEEAQEQSEGWVRGQRQKGPTTRSLRPDRWKGLETRQTGRARPKSEKWGEEAGEGQEQMRAAGTLNRPLDTENVNRGRECKGTKETWAW